MIEMTKNKVKIIFKSRFKVMPSNKMSTWMLVVINCLVYLSGNNVIKCQSDTVSQLWLTPFSPNHQGSISDNLTNILNRVGPNMRASADYHDFTDIRLNESIEAWKLLHEQVKSFSQNQVEIYRPKLIKLFEDSNVSEKCVKSLDLLLDSLANLESWAVKAWNSNGNFPPTGLFDGQFTDLGSFRGCIDIKVPHQVVKDDNKRVNESEFYTNYCVVAFKPIVPSRRLFHMIFQQESKELINSFHDNDVLNDVAKFAQYFHYVYIKTGTCLPSSCSPHDVQSIVRLISKRLALMPGPVKCFTRHVDHESKRTNNIGDIEDFSKIESGPFLIELNKPFNQKQLISLVIVGGFYILVALGTVWHLLHICFNYLSSRGIKMSGENMDNEVKFHNNLVTSNGSTTYMQPEIDPCKLRRVFIDYFSIITNGRQFFQTNMKSNEIKCLHGLRVLTMVWIIIVHTLQYNEWSGFTRVFENVSSLQSPVLHPLLNANYVVDNFFLMSGLLVAYTTWFNNKGTSSNYSMTASLIGRYLRLTPQVLLMSLLYIVLPLAGDGPFWYDMTNYEAKYCEKNWWVNLLHIQSFYRGDEMCNLVGWWISVDMFYYIFALIIVWMILNQHIKRAIISTFIFVGACISVSTYRHYTSGYTPNNLGVVPQIGEVWSKFVVTYVWTPYPHAYVFSLGLWIGYILATNKWHRQVVAWSRIGWIVSVISLIGVNYSSHLWMSSKVELGDQAISTSYNIICTIIWANAFGWVIVACHYGCGPNLSRFLSNELFVIISKASFIIYLSHMLIVRSLYGSRYYVLEVSMFTMTLIMLGNIVFSTILGIFLAISFEGPCMKFQKFVVDSMRPKQRELPMAGSSYDPVNRDEKNVHRLVLFK